MNRYKPYITQNYVYIDQCKKHVNIQRGIIAFTTSTLIPYSLPYFSLSLSHHYLLPSFSQPFTVKTQPCYVLRPRFCHALEALLKPSVVNRDILSSSVITENFCAKASKHHTGFYTMKVLNPLVTEFQVQAKPTQEADLGFHFGSF